MLGNANVSVVRSGRKICEIGKVQLSDTFRIFETMGIEISGYSFCISCLLLAGWEPANLIRTIGRNEVGASPIENRDSGLSFSESCPRKVAV